MMDLRVSETGHGVLVKQEGVLPGSVSTRVKKLKPSRSALFRRHHRQQFPGLDLVPNFSIAKEEHKFNKKTARKKMSA
jgi:hypothetical protein